MQNQLADVFDFKEVLSYYDKNKEKRWDEWLAFKTMLKKSGKQGLVGLFDSKDGKEGRSIAFKLSQYINYLIYHEYTVMNGLNELAPYCPHFCKAYGLISCEVNDDYKNSDNPFLSKTTGNIQTIETEVLLMEYIDSSYKFHSYIRSDKISEDVLYPTIKQVLIAIAIAQKKKRFTHYDLHSCNIMMRKCCKDTVFLYALDSKNQYCIPTRGHYPVIIDFGFSYIHDMEDDYCWPTLAHTDIGFISNKFDWVSDPKLFLVTASDEINEKRNSKRSRKLRRIVKNIFHDLDIDFESGWDRRRSSILDPIIESLKKHSGLSRLFTKYDFHCIDLIQTLIVLPLQEQSTDSIDISYRSFIAEFKKIEDEIGNLFFSLYVLKGVVDAARQVRFDYEEKGSKNVPPQERKGIPIKPNTYQEGKGRNRAVNYFRVSIYERVELVASYCELKSVNFEVMLCSLLVSVRCIEGMLFKEMKALNRSKDKEYRNLPLKSVEQIYGAIEYNIKDSYKFNTNTTVFVLDCETKGCIPIKLTAKECKQINKKDNTLSRGGYLWKI